MAWSIFTQGGGQQAALAWAHDLLKAISAPQSPGNVQFVYDWEVSEGGGGKYNPLNQGPVPGKPKLTTTGQQYGGGAADFASWSAGLAGASDYLHMPAYSGILESLKANRPEAARQALIASPWAASHYGYGSAFSNAPAPGAGSQLQAIETGIASGIESYLGGNASVGKGLNPVGGLETIGNALSGIADVVGKTATAIDWLLLPSHWVRIFAGALGGGLVLAGTWQLSHVGGDVPRAAALPLGMVLVGLGAMGLFVAFHNLPDRVDNFPSLLGYLKDNLHPAEASQ